MNFLTQYLDSPTYGIALLKLLFLEVMTMPVMLLNLMILLVIQTLFTVYLRTNVALNWFDTVLVYVVTSVIYFFGMYSVFATFTQGL